MHTFCLKDDVITAPTPISKYYQCSLSNKVELEKSSVSPSTDRPNLVYFFTERWQNVRSFA